MPAVDAESLAQSPSAIEVLEQFPENFEARYVASGSMLPTLEIDDKVIIDKRNYPSASSQRGDIILYNLPSTAFDAPIVNNTPALHRVVGLPGETIAVRDGQVYIDNQLLEETYLPQITPIDYEYGPQAIPEGHYFVLGDNRNVTFDSHIWGTLPQESILGKAIGIYCPVERQTLLTISPLDEDSQALFDAIAGLFQNVPALCHQQQSEALLIGSLLN
ncbi:MAG: signal peptidase I [Cyanobacteria bacterium J06638_28]